MKYIVEVWDQGKVIKRSQMGGITHPNQAVHRIAPYCTNHTNAVAVMNQNGDRWLYLIVKDGVRQARARQIRTDLASYNQNEILLIFSGNKRIYGAGEL